MAVSAQSESSPLNDRFDLERVIRGLASDLEAMAEARRLAVRFTGKDFLVLRLIGGFHMPAPGPEELIVNDGLPF